MTTPFRVVVAPDKFKGCLSADEVARTIAEALQHSSSTVEVLQHPVADGGEGTVDVALASGFSPVTVQVAGPIGASVDATFAMRERVAVVEMASAAGLAMLAGAPDRGTAWRATTYGVGQLVVAALDRGATRVVVGAGGSATTDGGAGAAEALGVDVVALGVARIRPDVVPAGLDPRLATADLVVACDVDNPLLGPDGAAVVYARQKGADPELIARLEARLTQWADAVARRTGEDVRDEPGVGAAGGLAFGLVALAGARIVSGAELLLELTGFVEVAGRADLIVVGEGSLDSQSLRGKGPVGIAREAAKLGIPVVAVAGRNQLSVAQQRESGLSAVYALSDLEPDLTVSMRDAERVLARVSQALAADWLPRPPTFP